MKVAAARAELQSLRDAHRWCPAIRSTCLHLLSIHGKDGHKREEYSTMAELNELLNQ